MRFKNEKIEISDKYSLSLDGEETQFLFATAMQCLRALKNSPSVMTKVHRNKLMLIYEEIDLLRYEIGLNEFLDSNKPEQ